MDAKLELAQLMARFKLMVRRSLNQSVDLERLSREPKYARLRLAEIEEAAMDEDLLVMVVRLRDLVLPPPVQVEIPPPPLEKPAKKLRDYSTGARAW